MLIDNCVTCHRAGGIGPFAMTDYNVVRGFAPMIREVVRTKRMPPWHADPHVGVFKDARGLTAEEAQKLVHWIEAGAPRGKGPGSRSPSTRSSGRSGRSASRTWWSKCPAFDVPATGIVDYQRYVVAEPDGTRCVGARDGYDSGRPRGGASRDRRRLRSGDARA